MKYKLPELKSLLTGKICIAALTFLFAANNSHAQVYSPLPYTTGFEAGVLDASWTTVMSLPTGEIRPFTSITAACVPHTGVYFLGMHHTSAGGGAYNLNEAKLHLNLAGTSNNLVMDFWWAEWNDETEPEDGIYISDNGGVNYTKMVNLPGASYTDLLWYHFVFDLDSAISVLGLSKTANFVIKFQQYDNYYFNGGNDGHMYDDINIYEDCVPTSSFTFTTDYPGKTATFKNTSSDSSNVLWDFGDAMTSTVASPAHTYALAGDYTVCLDVTAGCATTTFCDTITICDPLVPDFSFTRNALTINITNLSSDTSDVFWNFGNGKTSLKANPTHTYLNDGKYNVCMRVRHDCEQIIYCDSIRVCSALDASFTYTSSGANDGGPQYTFSYNGTANTPLSYSWDFGDGTSDTGVVSSHVYTANGIFNVVLTVDNLCGDQYDTTIALNVLNVGIETYGLNDEVSIYPNPNNGSFMVNMKAENMQLDVKNVEGQVVYSMDNGVKNNNGVREINLGNVSPGIYFVHIYTEAGQAVKKIMVK